MSNAAVPIGIDDSDDNISLPLYFCGLTVTWCGIFAVNAVLSNDPFTTETLMLSTCGFLFSLVCRRLRIDKRLINYVLPLLLVSYFGIRISRHSLDIMYFIPIEAQQNDNLIAVILVWVSVVRSWMLVTDGSVLFTSVTSIAMIGLVGAFNVNADQIVWFSVCIMATLYMVMHQNYLVHKNWLSGITESPSGVILRTHLMLCIAIGLGALIAGTLLVVPVRMMGANLSLGQAMRQFFAPGGGSDPVKGNSIDFQDDPTFTIGTGQGFTSDDMVVMTARPSDDQEHYWVGRTYDQYNRHSWSSTLSDREPIDPTPLAGDTADQLYMLKQFPDVEGIPRKYPPAPAHILQTTFNIMLGRTQTVYAPANTYEINLHSPVPPQIDQMPDGYVGYDSLQEKFRYIAVSDDTTPSLSELMHAKFTHIPPFIRQHYLDDRGQDVLSLSEQERLADTASSIEAKLPYGHNSTYERADAIREWVANRCVYSLTVDPIPQDQDAVSYFLFTSRKGYCDLFASSMALLCRYVGIPSRVVTGFAPGTRSQKDGFDIRARDKHAWVEVYIPSIGWYQFDPTSSAAPDSNKPQATDNGMDFFRRIYWFFVNFLNLNGPIPVILFAVVVLCLSYVIKIEVVDRVREEVRMRNKQALLESSGHIEQADTVMIETGRHLATTRYRRMLRALTTLGLPAREGRTPAAYAQLLHRVLSARYQPVNSTTASELLAAIDALTGDVIVAAFAPDDVALSLVTTAWDRRSQETLVLIERCAKAHWWREVIGIRRYVRPKKAPAT